MEAIGKTLLGAFLTISKVVNWERLFEYLRNTLSSPKRTAKRIVHCLKTGRFEAMPKKGTTIEVDLLVDLALISSHLVNNVFRLMVDPRANHFATQYWACYMSSTSNQEVIELLKLWQKKLRLVISNSEDLYTACQLLRALERASCTLPYTFLHGILHRESKPVILRAWAYVFLCKRDSVQIEDASLFEEMKGSVVAALRVMMDSKDTRRQYIACRLAGYLPSLTTLENELDWLTKHPMNFVRYAALESIRDRGAYSRNPQWTL